MIKDGSILCINSKKGGWFSSAQRFFTRQPYTHSAIAVNFADIPSYLGADLTVDIQPLDHLISNPDMDVEVWEWLVPEHNIKNAIKRVYLRYGGQTYGFGQVLWFVYRWVAEKFGLDVRKGKNWFPNNPICSEVTWWMCFYTLIDYPEAIRILNEWNPDTFHSGDQATVMRRFAEIGIVRRVI